MNMTVVVVLVKFIPLLFTNLPERCCAMFLRICSNVWCVAFFSEYTRISDYVTACQQNPTKNHEMHGA
jgi:hypothetical protein